MRCIECDALLSEYGLATERYTVLSGMLERADIPAAFRDLEFQKLKNEVAEARLNCHRTRKALAAHQQTQVCRRSSHLGIADRARTALESVVGLSLTVRRNPIS